VLDQAIGGQYPIVLSIFNYHAVISAAQGAPVEWLKVLPVLTFGTVSMVKKSHATIPAACARRNVVQHSDARMALGRFRLSSVDFRDRLLQRNGACPGYLFLFANDG